MTSTHPKTRKSPSASTGTALHFPWARISAAFEDLRAATAVRPLYELKTGKGMWLVGDEGIYLMPNAIAKNCTVVYARECDPTRLEFDSWWETKRATFGVDDGVEFIGIEEIERLAASAPRPSMKPRYLAIAMTPEQLSLSIV
jgi:hypothetical protein